MEISENHFKKVRNSGATDNNDVIEKRIKNAVIEVESINKYDYIIINDDLQKASRELVGVAQSAMLKTSLFSKDYIVANWLS